METKQFCTSCGEEMVAGTNFCDICAHKVKTPQNQVKTPQNFEVMAKNVDLSQVNNQVGGIELVAKKPRFITFDELKNLFLAYSVIYFGFTLRRVLITGNIISSVFETSVILVAIFGIWFLIDKFVSYHYNYYPKFIYHPEKAFTSLIFSFIFIGFPPGRYVYRIFNQKLPLPRDILKVHYLTYFFLTMYGWLWFYLITFNFIGNYKIFIIIPFIIAISIGIAILPFGSFKVIYDTNKSNYFILVFFVLTLFIESYPLLFVFNF